MIGKIKGTLSEVEGNVGLIETSGGVFYKVFLTPFILQTKAIGADIDIYTYLQVREDNLTLFGFEDKKRHTLFQMLLAVDGVGPKSAFGIVSFSESDKLIDAVNKNNVEFFTGIPGIGRKTAQKILLELSSKLGKAFEITDIALSAEDATAVDALVSLGFKRFEARTIVSKLDKNLSLEEKIKKAIQEMTKRKS